MDSDVSNLVVYMYWRITIKIRPLYSVARKCYVKIIFSTFGPYECLYRQFSKENSAIKCHCDDDHMADHEIFLKTANAETA